MKCGDINGKKCPDFHRSLLLQFIKPLIEYFKFKDILLIKEENIYESEYILHRDKFYKIIIWNMA